MCGLETDDPLARRFYKEHGLMILGRAMNTSKFRPGMFLRKPYEGSARTAVRELGRNVFTNWKDLEVDTERFTPISHDDWSGKISASAAAEISPTLTGTEDSAVSLSGAFEKAGVSSLRMALVGARLWSIDEAEFEQLSKELLPSDGLKDYFERGHRYFFVTDTLSVTAARIEFEDSNSASGFLEAAQSAFAKLAFRGKVDSEKKRVISVEPDGREVMIAFRCLELFIDEELTITGLGAPSDMLIYRKTDTPRPPENYARRSAFDDDDSLVLNLGEAD